MTLEYKYLDKKGSNDLVIGGTGVRVYTLKCEYETGETVAGVPSRRVWKKSEPGLPSVVAQDYRKGGPDPWRGYHPASG
jgi:hypothetical protein